MKQGSQVQLLSRNAKDLREKFPEVVEGIGRLSGKQAIIDGEIVALDSKGRSSFQRLQARERDRSGPPSYYYAFDLLQSNGKTCEIIPFIGKARPGKTPKEATRRSSLFGVPG